jgi:uncharacterized membrane protein YtjA (UPF0391 family)
MVLHAKPRKHLDSPIVAPDRHCHRHRPFRILQPVAFVGFNPKSIGDHIELPASHLEGRMLVNLHPVKLRAPALEVKRERVFPARALKGGGTFFQPDNRFKGDPSKPKLPSLRERFPSKEKRKIMLSWTIALLVIAIIAAILGFGGIAGTAAGLAKILFFVFLVLFVLSLLFGRRSV